MSLKQNDIWNEMQKELAEEKMLTKNSLLSRRVKCNYCGKNYPEDKMTSIEKINPNGEHYFIYACDPCNDKMEAYYAGKD